MFQVVALLARSYHTHSLPVLVCLLNSHELHHCLASGHPWICVRKARHLVVLAGGWQRCLKMDVELTVLYEVDFHTQCHTSLVCHGRLCTTKAGSLFLALYSF